MSETCNCQIYITHRPPLACNFIPTVSLVPSQILLTVSMVTTTQTVLDVHLTVQSSSILNNYSHSSSCHSQQDRYNPGNNYSCIFGQSSNSLGHRTTLFFALQLILSQLPRNPPCVSIITREQYKLSYAILFFPPYPEIGNTNFKCAL